MDIEKIIVTIKSELHTIFQAVDSWFEKPSNVVKYNPKAGGWSIELILEHVYLTSHFLLILIDKASNKALKNIHNFNLEEELKNYQFESELLMEVGKHLSFKWIRPEHMEPKGGMCGNELRKRIKEQVERCFHHLELLKNGEGVLYKTTMTVNNIGKLDVYQYIFFLALHAKRHITQMEKVESEYLVNDCKFKK
jgi:hypothetical protein